MAEREPIYSERARIDRVIAAIKAACENRAEIYLGRWSDESVGMVPHHTNSNGSLSPLYGHFTLSPTIREGFQQVLLTALPGDVREVLEREEAEINFSMPLKGSKPVLVSLVFTRPPEGIGEIRKKEKERILDRVGEAISSQNLKKAYLHQGDWWRDELKRVRASILEDEGMWDLVRKEFQKFEIAWIPLGESSPISLAEIEERIAIQGLLKQDKKTAALLIGRRLEALCESLYTIPEQPLSDEYALVVKNGTEQVTITLEAIKQERGSGERRLLSRLNRAMEFQGIKLRSQNRR